jgi:N,N'-diacetyllegionaminate synthase
MTEQQSQPATISIGGRMVGPRQPAFLVAEVGINHNGDMSLAREMIDAAAEAGADSVKFQNYRTEDFVSEHAKTYTYISQGRQIVESQFRMFKRCELTRDRVLDLATYCRKRGVIFHSTPTGPDGVRDLLDAGAPVIKNGSDYLSHLELIAAIGETGLPTVLSTGMAETAEIEDAVSAFRATGNDKLILLHCTSAYPTPDADVNVSRVRTLGETFGCLAGFSDHSEGITASMLSVAFGACWVEKHFTTDKGLPGPDQRFSLNPRELAELIKAVRTAERQIGDPAIAVAISEREARQQFRLSCVAARELRKGTVVGRDAIAFKRPGNGIPPKDVHLWLGRRMRRNVPAGYVLQLEDFESTG